MISSHLTWLLRVPRSKAQHNKAVINFTSASFLYSKDSYQVLLIFFCTTFARFYSSYNIFLFIKVPEFPFSSIRLYFPQMMFRRMIIITGLTFWGLANIFFEGMWSSSLESLPHVSVLKPKGIRANPHCLILISSEPGRLRTNLL